MADLSHGDAKAEHVVPVVIHGTVDLYDYDDLDRGDVTPEKIEVWKRMARDDIIDALESCLDGERPTIEWPEAAEEEA